LDRAEALIRPGGHKPPRQTDLRRAISDAYYAAFHAVLSAAADAAVGKRRRGTSHYSLAYRSIDHRALRELCQTVRLPTPSQRYRPHVPGDGFGQGIQDVAESVLILQRKRNIADYDPIYDVDGPEAEAAILMARKALIDWNAAPAAERETFVHLLLFPPR
jgi:hypothetical protein